MFGRGTGSKVHAWMVLFNFFLRNMEITIGASFCRQTVQLEPQFVRLPVVNLNTYRLIRITQGARLVVTTRHSAHIINASGKTLTTVAEKQHHDSNHG